MIDFAVETLFNLQKLARKLFTTGKYIPDIDVINVSGFNVVTFRNVSLTQYETLVLTGDDGKQYRIIRVEVSGRTTYRLVPVDYVEASNGSVYQLKVVLVNGVPTLSEPTLIS